MYDVDNSPVDNSRSWRCSSLRLSRSRSSSILFSDSVPSESSRFTRYERLSESMRLTTGESSLDLGVIKEKKRRNKAWGLISKVLSFRKSNGLDEAVKDVDGVKRDGLRVVEKTVKSRRSSWLPDPNRRWPVQGW
ncbi:hypothetical protein RND81_13G186400 [Saponaria officinalis]|uniref:Uncharacterized protein n=1 Tax=Saponaria officinalis TaxID=3572 RepID=A0AAW1H529_SAPOF